MLNILVRMVGRGAGAFSRIPRRFRKEDRAAGSRQFPGDETLGAMVPRPVAETAVPAGEPVLLTAAERFGVVGKGLTPSPGAVNGRLPVASAGRGDAQLIGGRIRGVNNAPLGGVVLTLMNHHGHQVSRTTSDSDGTYRIGAPLRGSYVLIVSADHHQPVALNVGISEHEQLLNLTLSASGELSGRVRSAHGQAVAGATITVTDRWGEIVGAAVSDQEGRYACQGITPGAYTLAAVCEHQCPFATSVRVPEGGLMNVDIELFSMAVLIGSAVSEGGRAVPDALVTLVNPAGQSVATTRTDEHGRYVIPDLLAGEYDVVARGYPPVTSRITVAGGESEHQVRLGYSEIMPVGSNSGSTEAWEIERQ